MNIFEKKNISLIIIFIMFSLILFPNVVSALENGVAEIRVESTKTTVFDGDTFDVTVSFKRNNSKATIEGINFKLLYNPDVLELTSTDNLFKDTITALTSCLDKPKAGEQNIKPGEVNFVGASTDNITEDKDLFTLSFKLKDNVSSGTTSLTIAGESILEDMNGNTSEVELTNSNIIVNLPDDDNKNSEITSDELQNKISSLTSLDENMQKENVTSNSKSLDSSTNANEDFTGASEKSTKNSNEKGKSITFILILVLGIILLVGLVTIKIIDKKTAKMKRSKK